ncbi:hypothetical protein [Corynebacterium pseudotuberculosis]|uniref:Uncharacterized protein n=1 Tax=Corynebacterium pseudotuberculosis (strain C231) TaxID=681645 RepID=D9QEN5_CORP2|nr:hypothetical protein [Corynebacterium pseudotuberculosis]ADK28265.2 hypothetical protein CPFRC_02375 [Corynebacterium pseudotuberculosis FRC41]ADL09958.1 hypothetical protein CPC231_02375 [Corynebacterium pseudotuberculosis C231]ADL20362.1 hypothetical protein CP1002_02375 [Corynebacterium pseudotuberculosis 1002]ADO25750.2 hypothetical protein CPI19_02375 [Corynebacterium pseudotuberculosis I19]AEK91801.1 Hypothetical protein CpPAT10_0472 [Corynebacterium pseudotuberculosis PAT10]
MRIDPDHARTLIAQLANDAASLVPIAHSVGASLPELGSFFAAYNSCLDAFMARSTAQCTRAEILVDKALHSLEAVENADTSLAFSLETL